MVDALLRPFYDPKFQTVGEFMTFFAHIWEEPRMICNDEGLRILTRV